jgi:D-alanyl-D-alanine carboxypeptidase
MKVWAKAVGSGALVTPEMQTERLKWVDGITDAKGNYGLAIGRAGDWLHHQGEMPGFNTIAAYLPQLDATMVVLCNTDTNKNGLTPAVAILARLGYYLAPEHTPQVPPIEPTGY